MNNLKILISFLFLYVGIASMINFLSYWKGNLKVWHDPKAKIFWTKFSEISLLILEEISSLIQEFLLLNAKISSIYF